MIDKNIAEYRARIRRIWSERLRVKLQKNDDLDKALLSQITKAMSLDLSSDFVYLYNIYLLMGDIQCILDGRSDLAIEEDITINLQKLLSTIKQGDL